MKHHTNVSERAQRRKRLTAKLADKAARDVERRRAKIEASARRQRGSWASETTESKPTT